LILLLIVSFVGIGVAIVLAAYNNRSVETMSIRDNLNEARLAVVREAFVEAGAQASRIAQSGAPALGAAHS
jgi:hypothetical protein